jgi:hypothetical protein
MLKQSNKRFIDNELLYPMKRTIEFINSPNNITKDKLIPTIITSFSVKFMLCNLSMLEISNPGINVRKINVKISLRIGISKSTEISVINMKSKIIIKNLLELTLLLIINSP